MRQSLALCPFRRGAWQSLNRLENVDGNAVELDWREKLGPESQTRRRKGFGSMVIERNLARALDAKVDLEFDPRWACTVISLFRQI